MMPLHQRDGTLPAVFGDAARQHAGRTALMEGDREVCYAELAERAGGIASLLQFDGARAPVAGQPVGLLLDHGTDMVAAILGTLAAGRCYVPLDPTYPQERLRAMLDQAGATVIVTRRLHRPLAEAILPPRLAVVAGIHAVDEIGTAPFHYGPASPTHPAYILFTSGSTGRPKGVVHSHRSVLNGIANHVRNLRLSPDDRLSLVTSFSYDMAVSDLYGALLSGAALVLCDVRTQGVARLAGALSRHRVTVYHSTPTVFRSLAHFVAEARGPSAKLSAVRLVLLGGEQATRGDLRLARAHFGPECVLVNGYGATEVSFTLQNHIPPAAELPDDAVAEVPGQEVLPIGRPLDGYEPVLLDLADGTPLPAGHPGPAELAIRSEYLALGYWGDPVATAERFGADGRLYRTGDVVRRLPDGEFVNLGRKDRQVKVRGHRIELGEVEAALESIEGVVRAVVAARTDKAGGTELHAFVRPGRDAALDAPQLRRHLARRLPAHMLPRRLSIVAGFPLTASGKVDVLALLANELPAYTPSATHAAPVGRREQLVGRIWSDVLGVGEVDRELSFFDAGGTSYILAQLQYRLEEATGTEVPLVSLAEQPTIAGMAALLDGADRGPNRGEIAQRMAARRNAQQRRAAAVKGA